MFCKNNEFWKHLDALVRDSEIIIDRPKDLPHPKFPDFIYPVNYGYLKNVSSADGNDLDIFVGTSKENIIDAIICTVDLNKKDAEFKILYGCTDLEKQKIYEVLNKKMRALIVYRSS